MRVGVIGGGLMGSGIAEVCARSGVDVTVVEVDDARLEQTRAKIDKSLDRAARSGKLETDDRAAAGDRLAYSTRLEDLEGSDAAIEAVVEHEPTKRELFLKLDEILPDAEFLASNTSSVPIMKLAADTSKPERAHTSAMPEPIRPPPITPNRMTGTLVVQAARGSERDGTMQTQSRRFVDPGNIARPAPRAAAASRASVHASPRLSTSCASAVSVPCASM